MRITTQQGNIATQVGGSPPPPSKMWPGFVLSDRLMVSWWPDNSIANTFHNASVNPPLGPNTPFDVNTYNVYRAPGLGAPFSAATKIKSGVIPKTFNNSTILYYYYVDNAVPLTPNTGYTYYVTASSPTNVESGPGPAYPVTTLAGTGTPPTPPAAVPDPATWIKPFALPNPALGTTFICTAAGTATGTPGPGVTIGTLTAGCSLTYAMANFNLAGGDRIVCKAGDIFTPPPTGYQTTGILTGTGGDTYIISSEDPIYKTGGKLPPYVDASNGPNYPFALTLTAAPAIGATSGTLTANWTKKTGIYPVQFFNSTAGSNQNEQRYVLFTLNSSAISWSATYNPNAIDGTLGAGLVTNCTAKISVAYLPGVTQWDCDVNGAMPIIQFGGPGTFGFGFQSNFKWNNLRMVGVAIMPVGTNAADNATFLNFACFGGTGTGSHVYFDRCLMGGNSALFTTTGWQQNGADPVVSSTAYGFVQNGISNIQCNNFLAHQCYFRGLARPISGVAQDSSSMFFLGGNPFCVQYCHIEAVSEGLISGGGFIAQANIPGNYTYRYNFNTKPQWWASAFQTLSLPPVVVPPSYVTINETGTGAVTYPVAGANFAESFRYGVWLNGVLQAPATYTIDDVGDTITFNAAVANGVAILIKFAAKLIFGDYIKNLYELKSCISAQAYGNVHWNCWFSVESGYLGSSFTATARDQVSSNSVNFQTIFGTCPWAQITDVDWHDNVSHEVGNGWHPFSGADYCPSAYASRLRFRNNQTFLQNPWIAGVIPQLRGTLYGAEFEGEIADVILDQNTWVADYTNSTVPGALRGLYFVTGRYDRFTITNDILPGTLAVGGDSNANLNTVLLQFPAAGGWNKNLTITDATTVFPASPSVTYQAVPYTSIGFTNFVDNFHPPAQPSDWNITGATIYATGSTTGTPVGAVFPLTTAAVPVFAFASGFTGSHAAFNVVNGEGAFADPDIQVTSPFTSAHRASAVWYRTQVNVQSFTTQFTIQLPSTAIFAAAPTGPYTPPCEGGMVFCIQNSNTTTNPGQNGAGITVNADTNLCGLGGFYNPLLNTFQYPVGNSIAIKFDQNNENNQSSLYPGGGVPNSFGLYVNGGPCAAMCPQDDLNPSGINFYNGNILAVTIVYDGTLLTMTLLDTVTNAQLRHSWPINIPQAMGGNSGWPGFGAGTIPPVAYTLKTWSWWQGFNTRLATPTFNVVSGSYTTAQTVTISAAAGASIYYTVNGQSPTTSSTLYTGPVSVSANTVLQAVAVQAGFTDSLVASADYQIQGAGLPHINFPNFTGAANLLSCVGTAAVSGTTLGINHTTDPGGGGGAAWYPVPVNIATFSTSFTFTPSSSGGFTFCIQNQPPGSDFTNNNSPPPAATSQALWDAGPGDPILRWSCGGPLAIANSSRGGLGYTGYPSTPSVCFPLSGFTRAIAVKFQASGGNGSNTGLYQGLVNIAANSVDMSGSNVHLNNGHSFTAALTYNGTTLTLSVTDTTTLTVFSTSFTVNIPSAVGASTAYVGFTGAGGGANQNITAWTYTDHFP